MSTTWSRILTALLAGRDLPAGHAAWAMEQLACGDATPAQAAGLMVALRAKGESVGELSAFVDVLLAHATAVPLAGTVVDIVGTGGDGAGAVNISTMAAVVAAAAGARVAKHGGRAASSTSCGPADLVEALGVPLRLTPPQAARIAADAGLVFLFAPAFHPALRHVAPARRELGVPTVFNLLAPLLNPARPDRQVIGVADGRRAPAIAAALAARGRRGLVVRGDDGLDKLTTTGPSRLWVVRDGEVAAATFDPAALGFARAALADLRGGSPAANVAVMQAVLAGQRGPVRDVVALNAAAAVAVASDGDGPVADQLAAALARCVDAIDSGAARGQLERWRAVTRRVASAPAAS